MRIIKPGREQDRNFECDVCGCVFAYSVHRDVEIVREYNADVVAIKAYVRCPCCRKAHEVDLPD